MRIRQSWELPARSPEREAAFEHLNKSLGNHEIELLFGYRYPALDAIRTDPRFAKISEGIGLSK